MPNIITTNPNRLNFQCNRDSGEYSGRQTFFVNEYSDGNDADISERNSLNSLNFNYSDDLTITENGGKYTVSLTDPGIMADGDYRYDIEIINSQGNYTYLPVNIKVMSSGSGIGAPTNQNTYSERYTGGFQDIEGTDYRFVIKQRGYSGKAIEIGGKASLSYQKRDNYFTPIIAASLQLELEANEDITLQDLYSEQENDFSVEFFRSDDLLFTGFIKPDGIFENWVVDRWELSIDAVDGLAYLKNLSFVDDNSISFTGNMTVISVISSCLRRTGLSLPINASCLLERGQTLNTNILFETVVKTERFFQNDGSQDPMDCDAVLRSTLQIFNLSLLQLNGEWYLFREIDSDKGSSVIFTRYDASGQPYPPAERFKALNVRENVGSHINSAEKFHCSGDQQKSARASVQAFRLYYKYGLAAAIMSNANFQMGAGLSSAGWIITGQHFNGTDKVVRNANGYGFSINLGFGSIQTWVAEQITNVFTILQFAQNVRVSKDTKLKFRAKWHGIVTQTVYMPITIKVGNYYLVEGVGWTTTPGLAATVSTNQLDGELVWEADSPLIPEDGQLLFSVGFRAVARGVSMEKQMVKLSFDEFSVTPSSTNYKGRIYTGQRKKRISSVTKSDLTVYNGDSRADLFVGTLYDADGITPTERWSRVGIAEEKELLAINVEDNLRIAPRTMMLFSGSVYGYVSPIAVVLIDGVSGRFQPLEWSYDAARNITKMQLREFEDAELSDFTIEDVPDVGQETKVTIRS